MPRSEQAFGTDAHLTLTLSQLNLMLRLLKLISRVFYLPVDLTTLFISLALRWVKESTA